MLFQVLARRICPSERQGWVEIVVSFLGGPSVLYVIDANQQIYAIGSGQRSELPYACERFHSPLTSLSWRVRGRSRRHWSLSRRLSSCRASPCASPSNQPDTARNRSFPSFSWACPAWAHWLPRPRTPRSLIPASRQRRSSPPSSMAHPTAETSPP